MAVDDNYRRPNAFGDAAAGPGYQNVQNPVKASGPLQRSLGQASLTTPVAAAQPVPGIGASLNPPATTPQRMTFTEAAQTGAGFGAQATSSPVAGDAGTPGYDLNARPTNFGQAVRQSNISKTVGPDGIVSYSGSDIGQDATINNRQPGGGYATVPGQSTLTQAAGLRPPDAPQFQAPQVLHSGNSWQARNDLRNAEVSANSITERPDWSGGRRGQPAAMSPAQSRYASLMDADRAARAAESAGGIAAMRENAALQQAGMQQAGDTLRARMNTDSAERRALLTTQADTQQAQMRENAANQRSIFQAAQNQQQHADRMGIDNRRLDIEAGKVSNALNKDERQQTKDTQDIFSILDQARPLLKDATNSFLGIAGDKVAQTFGASTKGADATAQLKALQGALVSKMPKMSGPQSDKDVLLYREMAGQIGDPTIPREQRMAAMQTIESLNMKYLPAVSDQATFDAFPSGQYFRTPVGDVIRKP